MMIPVICLVMPGVKPTICTIKNPCHYTIRGQLTAQDLDGHTFQQSFDFQINVTEAGHIYRNPPHQLYIVGEYINNDQAFLAAPNY